ncbi:MAG: 16S rRNA (adenine(1518)-N(6)/adenine(1519)-N(6))-dimethyltransferase RsmA [Desulfovibrio sp.]|jgi:16S rRNA (adenine1518-N6/adenine1519-N6)-dimethyltransferase|nr:16S rRNA (adenine(1518)-N(6)/adenine(1519)-N(6))-dimethyltransferase RsmA [Desulfovibrio sp.]
MEHRAKRSLGQNFLVDENTCRRIVDALHLSSDASVVEIGPGKGALTRYILEAAPRNYTAIEKDNALADRLQELYPQAQVRSEDALAFPWQTLNDSALRIAGNLPYNVGSRLIWDIVSRTARYERAVFMVQYEVALRLTADAGDKAYGSLGAWVRNFARTRLLFKVPPTVFRPRPKVFSAVVEFLPLPAELCPVDPEALAWTIRFCFQKRRKQLGNILKSQWNESINKWLSQQGLSGKSRPEVLTPRQFQMLSERIVMNNAGS